VKLHYNAGFSLLEILSIMILLGIMGTIIFIKMSQLIDVYHINSISQQLISDFYFARSKAISLNTNVVISICNANNTINTNGSYKIFIDNGEGGGISNNWIQDGNEKLLIYRKMPKSIKLYTCTFYNNKTGYQPDGSPLKQRWGSLYIKNKSKFYRMTLILTGRVKLYYSNNGIDWK